MLTSNSFNLTLVVLLIMSGNIICCGLERKVNSPAYFFVQGDVMQPHSQDRYNIDFAITWVR